ncbi:radical SAM protein [Candidatus Woesearchaeota archaeon]|nr:radical SAM protein [Candidatus Woesearchaeota archaeon]
MRKIEDTPYFSKKIGTLPKGCQLCVEGKKLVLVVTGLCSSKCYYCPLSDQKKDIDLVWANEWQTDQDKDIITEAELCSSKGAGFTGGDPLLKFDRTLHYIKLLKKRFGKHFHIHLYTPFELVTKEKLQKLEKAGLDEIRFHPKVEDNRLWEKLELAKTLNIDIGIEIPIIPNTEKQTITLIEYIKDKVKFLNLNELELSDNNTQQLTKLGFTPKNTLSYGVKDSEELALKIMEYCKKNTELNVHYCTTTLKDSVQLAERIKRRAKNIKQHYDTITDEGTIIRGVLYLPELKPDTGYRKKLQTIDKEPIIKKLKELQRKIKFHTDIDKIKLRLLCSKKQIIKNIKDIKQLNLIPAVVEEYPTHDALEIDVNFLD